MHQYASKNKTQSEKSRTDSSTVNKSHAQAHVKNPTSAESLFSPACNIEQDLENPEAMPLSMKQSEEHIRLAPAKPNNTGIPLQMKENFESLSGFSFDDVRVHYSSDKPTGLQALAYTQGNQVYVGPGQEKHLEHELGHVVQQKKGMVKPSLYLAGIPVNNDASLESQADTYVRSGGRLSSAPESSVAQRVAHMQNTAEPIQFWNFKAHLESLNRALEIARVEDEKDYFGLNKYGDIIRAGNLGNDLGKNTLNKKGEPDSDDMTGFGFKITGPAFSRDAKFIKASHKGRMQYLHSMKGDSDDNAEQVKAYVKFAYTVAKDVDSERVYSYPLKRLRREYYFEGKERVFNDLITIFGESHNLFDVTQLSRSYISKLESPATMESEDRKTRAYANAVRAYFLGSVTHIIQDSFCSSHTLRENFRTAKAMESYNPANDLETIKIPDDSSTHDSTLEALAGTTDIISTRDYITQSHIKHEIADRMVSGQIKETPGLLQATNAVSLVLASMNDLTITPNSMNKFFDALFKQKEGLPELPSGGRAYHNRSDFCLDKTEGDLNKKLLDYYNALKADELNDAPKMRRRKRLFGRRVPEWDDTRNSPAIIEAGERAGQLDNQLHLARSALGAVNYAINHDKPNKMLTHLQNLLTRDINEINAEIPAARKALEDMASLGESSSSSTSSMPTSTSTSSSSSSSSSTSTSSSSSST